MHPSLSISGGGFMGRGPALFCARLESETGIPLSSSLAWGAGIRMHGGNGPNDTLGCPLVAFNRVGNAIQGTAENALTQRIQDAGGACLIVVVDHLRPVP